MRIETLLFKEIVILPELFLGLSLVYLVLHCTFLAIKKKNLLIQNSVLYLGVLVLFLSCVLVVNDCLDVLELSSLNDTIINDYVSFSSKLVIGSLSLFCLLMIQPYLASQKINQFEYILLILFAVLGLFLLCSSNDLLTAYLAIELQSLAFYVLASFKKNSTYSVDAGIKYFILGAFSSSLFLFGSSLLYGVTGTINFEEFRDLLISVSPGDINTTFSDISFFDIGLIKFGLIFILISLLFKLAIAPFHTWAPDVYEGSPSASTFFFAVVPKLAIFVLLLRIFYYSFFGLFESWRYFIVVSVVLSVIVGSFGGLEQRKLKSLLVYSSISHMGYALIAFSAGTFESIQMLFCYLIVYSFSGLCVWSIFLLTRIKNNYLQKQNKDLTDLVLLGKSNYMLAIFFTTVLFSVAGFPPMIGFLVKISVFLTAIESSMYFVALLSILCSVIGTFYYIRLIKILYFEKVLVGKLYYPINLQSSVLISILFFLFLFLFINPTILYLFSYKFSLLISLAI
jgi:NADH-quinone oxidoreductase subunit N|tara:strand:+ start:1827 stop:3359 length:1533 start_codon:yes stop_codon:yes gene_type:complete